MKKPTRKELALTTTTVRTLVRTLDERAFEMIVGGLYANSGNCFTRPAAGCP